MARTTLRQLNKQIERATSSDEKSNLVEEKISLIKRKTIFCPNCGERKLLGKFGFIQKWWSDESGDSAKWQPMETSACHIICPTCRKTIYIYSHQQSNELVDAIDKQNVDKEKIFAEIWKQFGEQRPEQIYPKNQSRIFSTNQNRNR